MLSRRMFGVCLGLVVFLTGCSSTYFAALEKIGIPKRSLMVTRVKAAQESQEEAKEQFASALEKFSAVVKFDGGTLQARYDSLSAELAASEKKAADVTKRINSVASVSEALFEEWEAELDTYTNTKLRASSERTMRATQEKYQRMMAAMRRAESKLEPVLAPLRDNVLFLKHNLNAEAVGSLNSELASVEGDVGILLRDLERSIAESNAFIGQLGTAQ